MRPSSCRAALVSASMAVALVAGCGARRTQIVIGVATDMPAPDLLDQVRLAVMRDGREVLREEWPISGLPSMPYELPGSFGIYSDDGSEPRVSVSLTGWKDGRQIVSRDSLMSLVREKTLFVRMALVKKCIDADCPKGMTCIEGACAWPVIARAAPRDYLPEMIGSVTCRSGSVFINTSTRLPLPMMGAGDCAADEWCGESTCYRNAPVEDANDLGQIPLALDMAIPVIPMDLAGTDIVMPPPADLAQTPADLAMRDLVMMSMPDIAMSMDMAKAPADLAMSVDLSVLADLAPPPDLVMPDLVAPPDMAMIMQMGCPMMQMECNMMCVDPFTDDQNCGACDVVCGGGAPACCGGHCADLEGDVNNCGRCGRICLLMNATPRCNVGTCDIDSCNAGWDDCNMFPGDGCEVNITRDPLNCGGCGVPCGKGESCMMGVCVNPMPADMSLQVITNDGGKLDIADMIP